MMEDPWGPLMKRGMAAGGRKATLNLAAHGAGWTSQVPHQPLQLPMQSAPGFSGIPAAPPSAAVDISQVPPLPGALQQPLPPQSQLAADLGVAGRGSGAGWGARSDSAPVSAELLLANAPLGSDGTPLGRIFVGGLPQVSGGCVVLSPEFPSLAQFGSDLDVLVVPCRACP